MVKDFPACLLLGQAEGLKEGWRFAALFIWACCIFNLCRLKGPSDGIGLYGTKGSACFIGISLTAEFRFEGREGSVYWLLSNSGKMRGVFHMQSYAEISSNHLSVLVFHGEPFG
ncbi:hypothetical protein NEIPOLOT_00841 [Neisseria polysaccharea ATCC 43768]|uniref:hypothetical protein n=1 Tax=Neisseria polysaccharea TaxID=489 RepID=UPI0001D9D66E|nr:hypothetical protein [Neisseria polysaccharea]EFH23334.1 hypothetical protein NEIPOLOT_00841 [Neisseria polysaccharea ATCC 43768]